MRRPCPGSADGHPCPKRRHLTASSRDGRCSTCRSVDAEGQRPQDGDELLSVDLPRDVADAALDRIRPLIRRELRLVLAPSILEEFAIGCYRQGLVDGDLLARRGDA